MSAGLSKSLRLFVGVGRGRGQLFIRLILQFVNMQLLDLPTAHAHGPAVRPRYIGTEGSGLSQVARRGGKCRVLTTRVVLIEPLFVRSKSERLRICEVPCLVEVTRLVKNIVRDILRVLLQRGESARLAKGELCF